MQCHYCDEEAAVAVEKDHVKVGLLVTVVTLHASGYGVERF